MFSVVARGTAEGPRGGHVAVGSGRLAIFRKRHHASYEAAHSKSFPTANSRHFCSRIGGGRRRHQHQRIPCSDQATTAGQENIVIILTAYPGRHHRSSNPNCQRRGKVQLRQPQLPFTRAPSGNSMHRTSATGIRFLRCLQVPKLPQTTTGGLRFLSDMCHSRTTMDVTVGTSVRSPATARADDSGGCGGLVRTSTGPAANWQLRPGLGTHSCVGQRSSVHKATGPGPTRAPLHSGRVTTAPPQNTASYRGPTYSRGRGMHSGWEAHRIGVLFAMARCGVQKNSWSTRFSRRDCIQPVQPTSTRREHRQIPSHLRAGAVIGGPRSVDGRVPG